MRKLLFFLPPNHFPALQTLHWVGSTAQIGVFSSIRVLSIQEEKHFFSLFLCALGIQQGEIR
jgi:hypothetical protein